MYEFQPFDFGLPRVRDFRGISGKAFDGRGNYTLGIREQLISRKLILTKSIKRGMNISIYDGEKRRAVLRSLSGMLPTDNNKKMVLVVSSCRFLVDKTAFNQRRETTH